LSLDKGDKKKHQTNRIQASSPTATASRRHSFRRRLPTAGGRSGASFKGNQMTLLLQDINRLQEAFLRALAI
jgi:hypothetical protein